MVLGSADRLDLALELRNELVDSGAELVQAGYRGIVSCAGDSERVVRQVGEVLVDLVRTLVEQILEFVEERVDFGLALELGLAFEELPRPNLTPVSRSFVVRSSFIAASATRYAVDDAVAGSSAARPAIPRETAGRRTPRAISSRRDAKSGLSAAAALIAARFCSAARANAVKAREMRLPVSLMSSFR